MGEEIKGSECLGTGQDYQSDSPAGIAAAATAALLQLHHFHFHLGFPSAAAAAVPRTSGNRGSLVLEGNACLRVCLRCFLLFISSALFLHIFSHTFGPCLALLIGFVFFFYPAEIFAFCAHFYTKKKKKPRVSTKSTTVCC